MLAQEIICMSIEVGTEGKLGGQAVVEDVQGMCKVRHSFAAYGGESSAHNTP